MLRLHCLCIHSSRISREPQLRIVGVTAASQLLALLLLSLCFLLQCPSNATASAPASLRCLVNVTASAANVKTSIVGNCSFCVTFSNHLDGSRLLLCAASAAPAAASYTAASMQSEEALLSSSANEDTGQALARLELLAARRVGRGCQAACRPTMGTSEEQQACVYSEATRHNITNGQGTLLDTVVLGNATYNCCRSEDFCNTQPRRRRGEPSAAISTATANWLTKTILACACVCVLRSL